MKSKIFNEVKSTLKENYPTTVFALASIWPACGFLPAMPQVLIYAIPLIFAAYSFSMRRQMNGLVFALIAYIPLELLIAQPSTVFRSWPRYVLFLTLLMNVTPLLDSVKLRQHRDIMFRITLYACVFLGVGSFFARFLGINFMSNDYGHEGFIVGRFGGLTTQSMMLGPIAGIAACYLASRAYTSKRKLDWALVTMALGSVMFTASRSALMAAIAGVVVTLYRVSGSASKFAQVGIVTLVIASSTFSFWGSALDSVIEKNGSTSGLNLDSREELWAQRWDDFEYSPIVGVGFCAAASENAAGVDAASGRIESGSSWIIILSMLGVLGALFVIPIFYNAFMTAFRTKSDMGAVICGVLALFFIHMFAEGYVFAGGSTLSYMLWLTIGVALDSKYKQTV